MRREEALIAAIVSLQAIGGEINRDFKAGATAAVRAVLADPQTPIQQAEGKLSGFRDLHFFRAAPVGY